LVRVDDAHASGVKPRSNPWETAGPAPGG
jgi:hypothetical protein